MNFVEWMLPLFLILCAIGVSCVKSLLGALILFALYSLAMTILWIFLKAPDLAITEAAVGACVTGILFFLTFRRIRHMERRRAVQKQKESSPCMKN